MNQRLRSILRRAVLAVAIALPIVTFVGPAPALAASGGGCGSVLARPGYGDFYACISSPRWGIGWGDGYVRMYAGHPGCGMRHAAYVIETTSGNLVAYNGYSCPSGATGYIRYGTGAGRRRPYFCGLGRLIPQFR